MTLFAFEQKFARLKSPQLRFIARVALIDSNTSLSVEYFILGYAIRIFTASKFDSMRR